MKKNVASGSKRKLASSAAKPAKKAQKRSAPRRASGRKIDVEDCTQHYLASLLDPENVHGACLPAGFPLPSLKQYLFCAGNFQTTNGTAGCSNGGVVCTREIANNDIAVTASTSNLFAGTGVLPAQGDPGTTDTPMNSAYTIAAINASATGTQYRVVSACLKVRYVGRSDAMGGTMTWLETSDRQDLAGMSLGNMRANSNSFTTKVSKEWQQINLSGPAAPVELEYNIGTAFANYILGCYVANAVSTESLSFEFEYHMNIELIGQGVPGKLISHADPQGFGRVTTAVKAACLDSPLIPAETKKVLSSVYAAYEKGGAGAAGGAFVANYGPKILETVGKYASTAILASL